MPPLPDDDSLDRFCDLLKTIGNNNRFRILHYLLKGERSVGDLEKLLSIKQPNLSHELKKLRDIGLVHTRRQSKVVFYRIAGDLYHQLILQLETLMAPDRVLSANSASEPTLSNFERSSSQQTSFDRLGECGQFSIVNR